MERLFNHYRYKITGDRFREWACTFSAGGHQDVVGSFLKGLSRFPEVELLLNPSRSRVRGAIVFVPYCPKAICEIMPLRARGEVEKLIAGPSVRELSYAGYAPKLPVDLCVLPSEWEKKVYEAELRGLGNSMNIAVWAAGVDHEYWRPFRIQPSRGFRRVLVYVKHSGAEKLPDVIQSLRERNKEYRILNYGKYIPREYRELLEWCDFVVCLGESETQGIAFTQAWSMNRQTLIYDSPFISAYHKRDRALARLYASPAPYLSRFTGALWKNREELNCRLDNIALLSPREWVLKEQTNEIAVSKLLEAIRSA